MGEKRYNVMREVIFKLPLLNHDYHCAYFVAPSDATMEQVTALAKKKLRTRYTQFVFVDVNNIYKDQEVL